MIREAKSLARKALVGKYGTVILAGIIKDLIIIFTIIMGAFGIGLSLCYLPVDLNINFLPKAAVSNLGMVIAGIIIFTIALLLLMILGVWFEMGEKRLILNICRGYHYSVGDLFYGFKEGSHPWRYFGLYLIKDLLLTSVSVFPGILNIVKIININNYGAGLGAIQALEQSSGIGSTIIWLINLLLTMFLIFSELLLVDKKSESVIDSIKDSISLTKGHRLDIIWLITFSFILWKLLMVVCPIASLWIVPYMDATFTVYYLMCRDEADYVRGTQGNAEGNSEEVSGNRAAEGNSEEISGNKGVEGKPVNNNEEEISRKSAAEGNSANSNIEGNLGNSSAVGFTGKCEKETADDAPSYRTGKPWDIDYTRAPGTQGEMSGDISGETLGETENKSKIETESESNSESKSNLKNEPQDGDISHYFDDIINNI